MSDHLIELPRLPRILREEHGVPAPYPRVWRAVTDGLIPAERTGRRWFVRERDLPLIARTLAER